MDRDGRAVDPTGRAGAYADDPGAEQHAWVRLMPWWHAAFAVVVAGVGTGAAIQLRGDPVRLGAVLAILAGWAALYAVFMTGWLGWRAFGGSSHLLYLGVSTALFGAATFLWPTCGSLLIVLIPQCFMVLELRPAIAAVTGLSTLNVGADLYQQGAGTGTVVTSVGFGALGVVLAVLLGGYISKIIAQSMQRAELIDELERTRAELAELSRETGALAERERLAREIHDALAQGFTSVLMLLQAAEAALDRGDEPSARRQLALAEPAARDGLAEARSLIASLAPLHLQDAPLASAVARVCDELSARFGFTASFRLEGDPGRLAHNAEIVLLRAVQEALANVGRHAAAGSAEVTLSFGPDEATIEVSDDGVGFEPGRTEGFGLAQLRARAGQMGGRAEVTSSPGAGTRVKVAVPLDARRPAPEPGPAEGRLPEGVTRP